jgi:hypothetical protein
MKFSGSTSRATFAAACFFGGLMFQVGVRRLPASAEETVGRESAPLVKPAKPSTSRNFAAFLRPRSLGALAALLSEYPPPKEPDEFARYYDEHIRDLTPEFRSQMVRLIFAGFASGSLEDACSSAKALPDKGLRVEALVALAKNIDADKDSARLLFKAGSSPDERLQIWEGVLEGLDSQTPRENLDAASELASVAAEFDPIAEAFEVICTGVAKHWARKDPVGTWDYGCDEKGIFGLLLRKQAVLILAERRPQDALEMVRGFQYGEIKDEKDFYLGTIYKTIFAAPSTVNLSEFPESELKGPIVKGILSQALPNWPVDEIKQFFAANPEAAKIGSFSKLRIKAALSDPELIKEVLDENTVDALGKISMDCLSLSEPPDPAALALLLGKEEFGKAFDGSFEPEAWRMLARKDLDLAVRTLGGISDEKRRTRYLGEIVAEVGKTDPMAAIDLIERQELGDQARDQLAGRMMATWVQQDLGGASTWIAGLRSQPQKLSALSSVINAIESPPAELSEAFSDAFNAVASQSGDKGLPMDALQRLSESKAREAPEKALEWSDSITNPSGRLAARGEVFQTWASSDSTGYATWLAGSDRTAQDYPVAVRALIQNIPDDIPSSLLWAATISEGETRKEILSSIVKNANKYGVELDRILPESLQGDYSEIRGSNP